jgi:hypothetical protein
VNERNRSSTHLVQKFRNAKNEFERWKLAFFGYETSNLVVTARFYLTGLWALMQSRGKRSSDMAELRKMHDLFHSQVEVALLTKNDRAIAELSVALSEPAFPGGAFYQRDRRLLALVEWKMDKARCKKLRPVLLRQLARDIGYTGDLRALDRMATLVGIVIKKLPRGRPHN